MTTIATDGRAIAADGRVTAGGEIRTETFDKLWELPDDSVAGAAGQTEQSTVALRELNRAAAEKRLPEPTEGEYDIMRLYPSGAVALYSGRLDAPFFVEPPFTIGSGGEYARGALAAGASVRRAMKIAHQFDSSTGPLNQHYTVRR